MSVVYNPTISGGDDDSGGGGAATDLSNLTSPTAVNQDLTFSNSTATVTASNTLQLFGGNADQSQIYVQDGAISLFVGAAGDGSAAIDASQLNLQNSGGSSAVFYMQDASQSKYFAQKSPDTVATSYTIVWPNAPGTATQSLKIASVVGTVLTLAWA